MTILPSFGSMARLPTVPTFSDSDPQAALAQFLTARLLALPDTVTARTSDSADLALVARLRRSATSDPIHIRLIDRQRHILLIDIAERHGWTGHPDFLPEWAAPKKERS